MPVRKSYDFVARASVVAEPEACADETRTTATGVGAGPRSASGSQAVSVFVHLARQDLYLDPSLCIDGEDLGHGRVGVLGTHDHVSSRRSVRTPAGAVP